MAKDRKKVVHIHSALPDKQPTFSTLVPGELGVNNYAGNEFISTRNTEDKVVRFSSDGQMITWMEKKTVMPYKGFVRGEQGPDSTNGNNPSSDSYGSFGITEKDLLDNKSNIVVKLNQVASRNTAKYDNVNAATDAYGKLVNPTNDNGLTDGAGFYIDMSRYAMQGANPSFSSVTTTCHATLYGTTEIMGADGCGSLLNIKMRDITASADTSIAYITDNTVTIGTNNSTISGNTVENVLGDSSTVVSGSTSLKTPSTTIQSCTDFTVKSDAITLTACTNNGSFEVGAKDATFDSCGKFEVKSDDVDITGCTSNSDIRLSANTANIYGDNTVNISGGTVNETGTNIINLKGINQLNMSGASTNISAATLTASADTANITSVTDLNMNGDTVNMTGDSTVNISGGSMVNITGDTYLNLRGENITLSGVNQSVSGTNLTVNETDTDITSCGRVGVKTNDFSVTECENGNGKVNVKSTSTVLSGNTLNITEAVGTTLTTPSTTISGKTISITSDTKIDIDAPAIHFSGNSEFEISGNQTHISSCDKFDVYSDDIILSGCSENGSIKIGTKDLCLSGGSSAALFAEGDTSIGQSCDGTSSSRTTTVKGGTTNISATTLNTNATTANTTVNDMVNNVTAMTNTYGTVNTTATTVNETNTNLNVTAVTANYTGSTLNITANTILNVDAPNIVMDSGDIKVSACTEYEVTSNDITFKECKNERGHFSVLTDKVCVSAQTNADIWGASETKLGESCDGDVSTKTTVKGKTVEVSGDTVNVSGNTTISGDTTIGGDTVIDKGLHVKGATTFDDTVSFAFGLDASVTVDHGFYGVTGSPYNGNDDMLITIPSATSEVHHAAVSKTRGTDITNNMAPIVNQSVTSATASEAIQEVRERSIVTMVKADYDSIGDSTILAQYTVYQDGEARGTIDIPKDFLLIETPEVVLHDGKKRLKMVFGVKKGDESNSEVVYVDLTDLVKDWSGSSANNSITVSEVKTEDGVYYWDFATDGSKISANTRSEHIDSTDKVSDALKTLDTVKLDLADIKTISWTSGSTTASSNNTGNYAVTAAASFNIPSDASHINRQTVSWSYGNVTGATAGSYDPGAGTVNTTNNSRNVSFVIPNSVSHMGRSTVSWSYGDVCNNSGNSYDPGAAFNSSFTIPSSAAHIKRQTLSFSYGAPTTGVTSYDPGANTSNNCTSSTTVTIPTSIEHLSEWSRTCLTVDNDLCVNGKVSASGGFYTSSDKSLKENFGWVEEFDTNKVKNLKFRTFNYKNDDTKRKTYGVIAQELEDAGLNELVHYDDDGIRSVDYTGLLILKLAQIEKQYEDMARKMDLIISENKALKEQLVTGKTNK